MAPQIIFILVAAVTIGSALMVVTTRNLIHAALWLVVTLFATAIIFVFLDAEFLAVAQVVIYVGAIAILFIFTVMLTRRLMQDTGSQTNKGWWIGALIAVLLFLALVIMFRNWAGFSQFQAPMSTNFDPIALLGAALVAPGGFLVPFEIASVLLVAALIGAIVIARERE